MRSLFSREFHSLTLRRVVPWILVALASNNLPLLAKNSDEAILKAVRKGDAKKAASLVSRVSPDAAASALVEAATLGNLSVIQSMIASGADINTSVRATRQSFPSTDSLFVLWNFVLLCNVSSAELRTPLIAAARAGKLETAKWLVENGANVNVRGRACIFENLRQQSGISVFRPVVVDNGNSALSEVILAGQIPISRLLVASGADLSQMVVFKSATIRGVLPVMSPTQQGGAVIERGDGSTFVDDGVHLRVGDDHSISTDLKVEVQEEATVGELLSRSIYADIRALGTRPQTPEAKNSSDILAASRDGDLAKVTAILKSHPELVSSKDEYGDTPLHWAALNGHREVGELLLANKAMVDAKDNRGETALYWAVLGGHKEMVELLRQHGGHE